MNCFDEQSILPTGRTAVAEFERTKQRNARIESKISLHTIWTCEIQSMLDADQEMKEFFNDQFDLGPLRIRDAYFGGRTGPSKLQSEASKGFVIKYKGWLININKAYLIKKN